MAHLRARLRFGVVGTGPWATALHIPAAASSEDVRLSAVLGRDSGRTRAVAGAAGVPGFTDKASFFDEVDIVGFAVPPESQAELALAAVRAGKHLLLDKPVATTVTDARAVAAALTEQNLASVVFFTHRFVPAFTHWLDTLIERGGWEFGHSETFSSLLLDSSNPYNSSRWRRERGALWDLGPHAISTLSAVLGSIVSVSGTRGPGDLTSVSFRHEMGATSSIRVALDAPPGVAGGGTYFVGRSGRAAPPPIVDWVADATVAYRAALAVLSAASKNLGLAPHPSGIQLGVHVVDALESAEQAIATEGVVELTTRLS